MAANVSEGATREELSRMNPLKVRSASERPDDAFVAVEYEGSWFHIPKSDEQSKEAFALLTYLFMLQAPTTPSAGPVITVPAG